MTLHILNVINKSPISSRPIIDLACFSASIGDPTEILSLFITYLNSLLYVAFLNSGCMTYLSTSASAPYYSIANIARNIKGYPRV